MQDSFQAFSDFIWKANKWNLWLVERITVGGFIAFKFLIFQAPQINEEAVLKLKDYGINSANFLVMLYLVWAIYSFPL